MAFGNNLPLNPQNNVDFRKTVALYFGCFQLIKKAMEDDITPKPEGGTKEPFLLEPGWKPNPEPSEVAWDKLTDWMPSPAAHLFTPESLTEQQKSDNLFLLEQIERNIEDKNLPIDIAREYLTDLGSYIAELYKAIPRETEEQKREEFDIPEVKDVLISLLSSPTKENVDFLRDFIENAFFEVSKAKQEALKSAHYRVQAFLKLASMPKRVLRNSRSFS